MVSATAAVPRLSHSERSVAHAWCGSKCLPSTAAARRMTALRAPVDRGRDSPIARSLRSESGRLLSGKDMALLTRSAILDTISPAAADAITGISGAGDRLRALADRSELIVTLDPCGQQLRYHTRLRALLLAELERREPGATRRLHRRAADWYRSTDELDRAMQHANAGGDWMRAAGMVSAAGWDSAGDSVDRCLAQFDRVAFERYPPLAVAAAWRHLLAGRRPAADDMADIAERSIYREQPLDGSASFESQRARLRAVMARRGPRSVLEDARLAVSEEGPASPWRSSALWLLGEGLLLLGDRVKALRALRAAVDARSSRDPIAQSVARARLAIASFEQGDWATADSLVRDTRSQVLARGYGPNPASLMVFAVDARVAIHRGDVARARDDLERAGKLWPVVNHGMPWLSVDALLDLVQAFLSASDPRAAEAVLRHAMHIARMRPDLGALTPRLLDAQARVADASSTLVGGSVLTPAELRVVRFLPTHLSFQEIADRLTISRNTVKTHAMSIYGKLWVSSRDEAVRRGVQLGLLEPHPVLAAESTISRAAGDLTPRPAITPFGGSVER
jgi:LuxR family transcriptional regulator, maltose regulon positive regulatory protein